MRAGAISNLLKAPETCQAYMGLPFKDKRRGGIWHCKLARLNIGKGRTRPECICRQALTSTTDTQP
jgi:hypothetical protein